MHVYSIITLVVCVCSIITLVGSVLLYAIIVCVVGMCLLYNHVGDSMCVSTYFCIGVYMCAHTCGT